jgi:hypothetical protein
MHPLEGEGLTTQNSKAMGETQNRTLVDDRSSQAALRTSTENGTPEKNDRFAEALRGFGPLGILAVLVIFAGNLIVAPLSAVLVLVWAKLSRTPWREIGYVRPRSWIGGLVVGIGVGVVLKFLMKMIVMPLLGADPINQTYHVDNVGILRIPPLPTRACRRPTSDDRRARLRDDLRGHRADLDVDVYACRV